MLNHKIHGVSENTQGNAVKI